MTNDELAAKIIDGIIAKSAAIRATIRRAIADSPWMTGDEAAERLRISPRKIKELRESGKLVGGLIPSMDQYRYHRNDVDRCVVMPRRIA